MDIYDLWQLWTSSKSVTFGNGSLVTCVYILTSDNCELVPNQWHLWSGPVVICVPHLPFALLLNTWTGLLLLLTRSLPFALFLPRPDCWWWSHRSLPSLSWVFHCCIYVNKSSEEAYQVLYWAALLSSSAAVHDTGGLWRHASPFMYRSGWISTSEKRETLVNLNWSGGELLWDFCNVKLNCF